MRQTIVKGKKKSLHKEMEPKTSFRMDYITKISKVNGTD